MIEIEHTKDGITKIDNTGIELRDYFAARAMEALIIVGTQQSDPWYIRVKQWFTGNGRHFDMPTYSHTAETAYLQADAMLRARKPIEWTSTPTQVFWNNESYSYGSMVTFPDKS